MSGSVGALDLEAAIRRSSEWPTQAGPTSEDRMLMERDSIERVFLIENHDEALYRWRDNGVRGRVVVHMDAHHDTGWSSSEGPITIANYVHAAVAAGLVREVIWVVPDPSWQTAGTRRPIVHHLMKMSAERPRTVMGADGRPSRISTMLPGGAVFSACPLSELPCLDEPVLLDIDVDYFLIPLIAYAAPDRHAALPWCWPEDVVTSLRDRAVRADLVTIAYSVEGGYTPLRWKYLGDEVASRLKGLEPTSPEISAARLIRQGAVHADRGDFAAAEDSFRRACEGLGQFPAPHFHLAHLYLDTGRVNEARASIRRVQALDGRYRTAYSSAGLRFLQQGALAAAEREYHRVLQLDPEDAFALAGSGWLAARRKQWKGAERLLRQSLALNPTQLDVHRLLGDVCARQRQWTPAARAYNDAIKLALSGGRSLDAPIRTVPGTEFGDPGHARTYAQLARVCARQGDVADAISSCRISLAAGLDGTVCRGLLACLYWRQGRWREAGAQVCRALSQVPTDVTRYLRRAFNRLRQAVGGRPEVVSPFSLS